MNLLEFWGKAQPLHPDCSRKWHPLAFHCLDVVAVGEALLTRHSKLAVHLSQLLGLPQEDAVNLLVYLLCLHDVGKFARKFQAKVPEHFPNSLKDNSELPPVIYDHGAGGLHLFQADSEAFGLPGVNRSGVWLPLVSAVTGHHGAPPLMHTGETLVTLRPDFGKKGIEAAHLFLQRAQELLPVSPAAPDRNNARCASFAVAGLAVLADWIGSNRDWFGYCAPDGFKDL